MEPIKLTARQARRLWLAAQKLDVETPFGDGPAAVTAAVEHLGYVQIDTINVIERCHHHILFNRIPDYRRADLRHAQSVDRSVFEYWTHALSYVPTRDIRFFLPDMRDHRLEPKRWYAGGDPSEVRRLLRRIRNEGAISIRDVEDDELIEKNHPWASRKPSKQLLQRAFYDGTLTISARQGMVKTYELMDRHFGWPPRPRPATRGQVLDYLIDRALRSQGVVSNESIRHLTKNVIKPLNELLDKRTRGKKLLPVVIEGAAEVPHWIEPSVLETANAPLADIVHILSPFDPLIIQRKRTKLIFGYEHLFEAYVTPQKRQLGYFTLPVLVGDEIVAGLDLKTDRAAGKVLIQAWHWFGNGKARSHKRPIEEALHRFQRFQLAV
jgi:uncharacterized protein YcaQ